MNCPAHIGVIQVGGKDRGWRRGKDRGRWATVSPSRSTGPRADGRSSPAGTRGAAGRDGDPERDPWAGRADRFAAYSGRLPAGDPLFPRLRAALHPDDTVLDIGAGAGRYALPLAQLARRVIAVEPSPALRRHLAARVAAEGAENVEVVTGAWPAVETAPADLVLCAHVVYGVREIAPFLRRLDRAARRLCLVAIRVD